MAEHPPPRVTPLHDLHVRLGARMTTFAGYDMPVQYPGGIRSEHLHVRDRAGLFDVSHMGQVRISGPGGARELEALTPASLQELAPGQMRYGLFTTPAGGVLDDFMAVCRDDHLLLVVNAACVAQDVELVQAGLVSARAELLEDMALLALQGPAAEGVLAGMAPEAAGLRFMSAGEIELLGTPCLVSRSGYTGEDGFEISVPNERAVALAEALLEHPDVRPVGLGARDSLRLEAGLCLYGHDLSPSITPVEAALTWSIGKRRRAEGGFAGEQTILRQLADGAPRRRVGLRPLGRAPAREHSEIVGSDGRVIGEVTSGGFSPSLNAPVAMGYVDVNSSGEGTEVDIRVRGTPRPARVSRLPFVPARYKR